MSVDKKTVMQKLQQASEIYMILSNYTRMPFVMCDPETFEDEILVYFEKQDADVRAKELTDSGNPTAVTRIENKAFLSIYAGLYPMGIDCICVDQGKDSETHVHLEELVRRQDQKTLPNGQMIIENPALHLTALYFMQEFRKKERTELTEELQEMQEELLAHYSKGTFLVALKADGKGIVIIKNKQGMPLLPIFTDMPEFHKFQLANPKEKFGTGMIKAEKVVSVLPPDAAAVILNPMTANIPLNVQRRA
ncbi:MAG: SseB family protein [Frisingicoccus sp.]|nr:SseB family protein [Frisingicoccus sp.]